MHESDSIRQIEARMAAFEKRLNMIHGDVFHLKEAMEANTTALKEYIELAQGFKLGLKLLGNIERVAVFFTKIGAFLGLLWAIWVFLVKEALTKGK